MNHIETENTRKVIHILRRYTDKPIEVKDIAEFANHPSTAHMVNYGGASKEYSDKIEIHLNLTKPEDNREAILVHELLHIVLRQEGFPGIGIRADLYRSLRPEDASILDKLRDRFSTTIHHLLVYKRMITNFSLNFGLYFEDLVQAKIRRFGKFPYKTHTKDAEYYFQVQQDILDGSDYLQYPNHYSQRILAIFKETCPEGFTSCLALHQKINKIGYSTPQLMFRCANLIRDQIIKYGHKKSLGRSNQYWSLLSVVRDGRDLPLAKGS